MLTSPFLAALTRERPPTPQRRYIRSTSLILASPARAADHLEWPLAGNDSNGQNKYTSAPALNGAHSDTKRSGVPLVMPTPRFDRWRSVLPTTSHFRYFRAHHT